MADTDRRRQRIISASVLLIQLATLAPPAAGAAPSPQPAAVQTATRLFEQARYDEAIALLRRPLDRNELGPRARLAAQLVVTRAYVKKGMPDRARQYYQDVLAENPGFKPAADQLDSEDLGVLYPPMVKTPAMQLA